MIDQYTIKLENENQLLNKKLIETEKELRRVGGAIPLDTKLQHLNNQYQNEIKRLREIIQEYQNKYGIIKEHASNTPT